MNEPISTPDLRAAIERLAADYATDEMQEFTGGGVAAALRAALAASPAPTDTPDERCGAHWGYDNPRTDHAMHRCQQTGDHGLRHRCACSATADEVGGERTEPTDTPANNPFQPTTGGPIASDTANSRPMERPREFDIERATPDAPDAGAMLRYYRAAKRATPDPDTLAALLLETDSHDWGSWAIAPDTVRDPFRAWADRLIAAGVTLN